MPSDDNPNGQSGADAADSLREQAAACRRLSVKARTRSGVKALEALGEHFDKKAREIDPSSMRR
ncbi:MAG TPA: hypothetical protein VJM15_02150 [Sphingomicrobium sp.]|nr:hypothetical protein [Sphingomicrobium sp.]